MANTNASTSQEVLEKIEQIPAAEPQKIDELVQELEQHQFFVDMDLDTMEVQMDVREKIDKLLGSFKIISAEEYDLQSRLQMLHDWLENAIELKEKRPKPIEPEVKEAEEVAVTEDVETQDIVSEEEREEEEEEEEEKEEEAEKTQDDITSLFKDILRNPDDFDEDLDNITDPAILATIDLLKKENMWPGAEKFDEEKFDKLEASLHASEKVPTASLRAAIEEWHKKGIKTVDQLDQRIAKVEKAIDDKEGEIDDLNAQISQQSTIMSSMRGNITPEDRKKLGDLNTGLTTKRGGLRTDKNILRQLKAIQPYFGENKMESRQILIKVLQLTRGKGKSLQKIGEEAETLIGRQEKELMQVSRFDKVLGLFKPSLKVTLKEFSKIDELKELKPEDLEALLSLRNNPDGLMAWIKKLKENAPKIVPVVIAYLKIAITGKKLNFLSRKQTVDLLRNLRLTRNKLISQKINKDPELANAKPQIKMQAYLKELNSWDEKTVEVDRNIIQDITTRSALSKVSKLAVGGVALSYAWPLLSLPAITGALSYLGWGNVAWIGGHAVGKKLIKTYEPESEKAYRHTVTRIAGLGVFGPIGLIAPELLKGLKLIFKKRKEIKAGAEKTGKVAKKTARTTKKVVKGAAIGAAATAAGTWAVAKGAKKALTYPFRAIGKRRLAA